MLERVRIKGAYLNTIKAAHSKSTDSIIINAEKLKATPANQEQDRISHSPHTFSRECLKYQPGQ